MNMRGTLLLALWVRDTSLFMYDSIEVSKARCSAFMFRFVILFVGNTIPPSGFGECRSLGPQPQLQQRTASSPKRRWTTLDRIELTATGPGTATRAGARAQPLEGGAPSGRAPPAKPPTWTREFLPNFIVLARWCCEESGPAEDRPLHVHGCERAFMARGGQLFLWLLMYACTRVRQRASSLRWSRIDDVSDVRSYLSRLLAFHLLLACTVAGFDSPFQTIKHAAPNGVGGSNMRWLQCAIILVNMPASRAYEPNTDLVVSRRKQFLLHMDVKSSADGFSFRR